MMLISFIIPCYNVAGGFLRECLETLTSPVLSDVGREIILVDDGSEHWDDSLADNFSPYIQVVRTEHRGVSAARNTGLRHAQGEYVHFIDADDTIQPDNYRRCLRLLEQTGCDVLLFGTGDAPTEARMSGSEYMLRHNLHGAVWNYVFRRRLADSVRFTEGVAFAEDEEFTVRLMLAARSIAGTATLPYNYRRHGLSATGNINDETVIRRLHDTESVLTRLQDLAAALQGTDKKAVERRTAQLTMDCLYNAMTLSGTRADVEQCVSRLRRQGLFPLPRRRYTWKYFLFSIITSTTAGRRLLRQVIHHTHTQQ